MLISLKGIGLLLCMLALFSLFSMKAPKGQDAMGGMANAAVATFLIEAVLKYIAGDLIGISFLGEVGTIAGSMGGVAAAFLVPLGMGVNPVFAAVCGVALGGYGILPGFISGYIVGLVAPLIEKYLPKGVNMIAGAFVLAPLARGIAYFCGPFVDMIIGTIGEAVTQATTVNPILMGFLLGGIMKVVCTSPLSSMALTAMLGLKGLPMGIAAIACFGGSFTNGMIFYGLKLGNKSRVLSVMLEPLTQADIVTKNPIPIYGSNFFGGGIAGIGAAILGIVNNAPGTASPIPGLIAPFAFNEPIKVIIALVIAAMGGTFAGLVGAFLFGRTKVKNKIKIYRAAEVTQD